MDELQRILGGLMTTRDLAERCGYSQVYANELIRQGRIPAIKTRLGYFIPREVVEAEAAKRAVRQEAMK